MDTENYVEVTQNRQYRYRSKVQILVDAHLRDESFSGNSTRGRRCGNRSAYSKSGGYAPICFAQDVTKSMIEAYR